MGVSIARFICTLIIPANGTSAQSPSSVVAGLQVWYVQREHPCLYCINQSTRHLKRSFASSGIMSVQKDRAIQSPTPSADESEGRGKASTTLFACCVALRYSRVCSPYVGLLSDHEQRKKYHTAEPAEDGESLTSTSGSALLFYDIEYSVQEGRTLKRPWAKRRRQAVLQRIRYVKTKNGN